MERNPVQFQQGLGLAAFRRRYDSEGQGADALCKARWPHVFR